MSVPRSGSRGQSAFHPPQPLSTHRRPRKGRQNREFGKRKFLYARVNRYVSVLRKCPVVNSTINRKHPFPKQGQVSFSGKLLRLSDRLDNISYLTYTPN